MTEISYKIKCNGNIVPCLVFTDFDLARTKALSMKKSPDSELTNVIEVVKITNSLEEVISDSELTKELVKLNEPVEKKNFVSLRYLNSLNDYELFYLFKDANISNQSINNLFLSLINSNEYVVNSDSLTLNILIMSFPLSRHLFDKEEYFTQSGYFFDRMFSNIISSPESFYSKMIFSKNDIESLTSLKDYIYLFKFAKKEMTINTLFKSYLSEIESFDSDVDQYLSKLDTRLNSLNIKLDSLNKEHEYFSSLSIKDNLTVDCKNRLDKLLKDINYEFKESSNTKIQFSKDIDYCNKSRGSFKDLLLLISNKILILNNYIEQNDFSYLKDLKDYIDSGLEGGLGVIN